MIAAYLAVVGALFLEAHRAFCFVEEWDMRMYFVLVSWRLGAPITVQLPACHVTCPC